MEPFFSLKDKIGLTYFQAFVCSHETVFTSCDMILKYRIMFLTLASIVFLPGESQGQGSLVGCRLWGRIESNMTMQQHSQRRVFDRSMEPLCTFGSKTKASMEERLISTGSQSKGRKTKLVKDQL